MFIERFCDKIMQQSRGHFEISPCILASFHSRKDIKLASFVWHMCVQACVLVCVVHAIILVILYDVKMQWKLFSSHCLKIYSSLIITYFINIDCPLCINPLFHLCKSKQDIIGLHKASIYSNIKILSPNFSLEKRDEENKYNDSKNPYTRYNV